MHKWLPLKAMLCSSSAGAVMDFVGQRDLEVYFSNFF